MASGTGPDHSRIASRARLRLLILAPLSLFLAALFLREHWLSRPRPGDVLRTGTIIGQSRVQDESGDLRPRILVRMEDGRGLVRAVPGLLASTERGARVRFYWGSEPDREVRLLPPIDPLWPAVLFLLLPTAGLALLRRGSRAQPPRARGV